MQIFDYEKTNFIDSSRVYYYGGKVLGTFIIIKFSRQSVLLSDTKSFESKITDFLFCFQD